MRTVIERTWSDNRSTYTPSTYEAAENLAGHRLDRRKHYMISEGIVLELMRCTIACSGCSCDCSSCSMGYGSHGNGGCRECGYTGRSRIAMWMPIDSMLERSLAESTP